VPTTYAADVSVADYTPLGDGTTHTFDLWRPGDGTDTEGNAVVYPVLVALPDAGAKTSTTLDPGDGLAYLARAGGFAVVRADYTHRDASLPNGGGFDVTDSDHYPERDASYLVQYLRANAASLSLDPANIVLWGVRRGANAAAWAGLGPDIADPGGNAQEQQSSRVRSIILENVVASWAAMDQSRTFAKDFSAVVGQRLSAIAGATQDAASPQVYGDDSRNAAMPVYLVHDKVSESTTITPPLPTDEIVETGSAWHGEVLEAMLRALGLVFHRDWSRRADTSPTGIRPDAVLDQILDWTLWTGGRLPVEELVLQALENRIAQITHANGYGTDVRRVFRWEDVDAAGRDYPAVMLTAMDDSYDDRSFATKSSNTLRVGATLYNSGYQRATTRASLFVADLRRALDDVLYWESRSSAARIGIGGPMVHVESARRFAAEIDERAVSGATAEIRVDFRDRIDDPYVELP